MSAYCTSPDIAIHGVNAAAIASVTSEAMTQAIVAASADIDSYLKGSERYTLPLVSWGGELTHAAAVIVAWRLIGAKGLRPGENPEDSALYLEYKRVFEWLKMVANGTVVPGDIVDSSPPVSPTASQFDAGIVSSNEPRGYSGPASGAYMPFQGRRS